MKIRMSNDLDWYQKIPEEFGVNEVASATVQADLKNRYDLVDGFAGAMRTNVEEFADEQRQYHKFGVLLEAEKGSGAVSNFEQLLNDALPRDKYGSIEVIDSEADFSDIEPGNLLRTATVELDEEYLREKLESSEYGETGNLDITDDLRAVDIGMVPYSEVVDSEEIR